ncbi:unnamed protein product [Phaeothamnion confervicola]
MRARFHVVVLGCGLAFSPRENHLYGAQPSVRLIMQASGATEVPEPRMILMSSGFHSAAKLQAYHSLLDSGIGDHLAYIPTAALCPNRTSDRPLGQQRRKLRYEARRKCDEIATRLGVRAELLDLADYAISLQESSDAVPVSGTTAHSSGGGESGASAGKSKSSGSSRSEKGQTALFRALYGAHSIYVDGGNTFYLQHFIRRTGFAAAIDELVRRRGAVYIGVSAGAIVAGRSASTALWKGWDDPAVVDDDWTAAEALDGLDLAGGRSFFPHYEVSA